MKQRKVTLNENLFSFTASLFAGASREILGHLKIPENTEVNRYDDNVDKIDDAGNNRS